MDKCKINLRISAFFGKINLRISAIFDKINLRISAIFNVIICIYHCRWRRIHNNLNNMIQQLFREQQHSSRLGRRPNTIRQAPQIATSNFGDPAGQWTNKSGNISKNLRQFLGMLLTDFTKQDAVKQAEVLGISVDTMKRWLTKYTQSGEIQRIEHGKYRKISS